MVVLNSGISWCSGTLNAWVGCTPVSAGCDNCYAASLVGRGFFGHRFEDVKLHLNRLQQLGKMKAHRAPDGTLSPFLCFVNSMSDFFHEQVPDDAIHTALDAFERHPTTIMQILTKRPIRARKILVDRYGNSGMPANFWCGVSVEDNRVAGRLNILRTIKERTGGTMTAFASVEPIVGPTDALDFSGIDWAIFGGESGPKARIMELAWLTAGIDHAKAAGSAVWLKQHGQIKSNPLLRHAPEDRNLKDRFQWLVDNGLEILPLEKGGATLEGKVTYRQFPPHYHAAKASLNAGRLDRAMI
jgi:protein gp37